MIEGERENSPPNFSDLHCYKQMGIGREEGGGVDTLSGGCQEISICPEGWMLLYSQWLVQYFIFLFRRCVLNNSDFTILTCRRTPAGNNSLISVKESIDEAYSPWMILTKKREKEETNVFPSSKKISSKCGLDFYIYNFRESYFLSLYILRDVRAKRTIDVFRNIFIRDLEQCISLFRSRSKYA